MSNTTLRPAVAGPLEPSVGRPAPKRTWDVARMSCRGPCWRKFYTVAVVSGHDVVGPYHLNAACNVKRFRSEAAARRVADRLNAAEG